MLHHTTKTYGSFGHGVTTTQQPGRMAAQVCLGRWLGAAWPPAPPPPLPLTPFLPPVALAPASRGSSLLAGLGSSLPAFDSDSSLLLLPSPGRWSAMLTATFVGTNRENSSLLKLTES